MRSLRDAAWRARDFFRRDAVLTIACVLAAASCVAVPPDAGYADYIDWRTIGLLFSLWSLHRAWRARACWRACRALVRACKSGGVLIAALVGLTFFVSMVVTNDVALVPSCARRHRLARESGPRASTCVRHSMYDRRSERRQHAHAHRQPAEHLSLKRIRHERGGTRGHHGSVFCRGIRVALRRLSAANCVIANASSIFRHRWRA